MAKIVEEIEIRVDNSRAKQAAKDTEKAFGKMFQKAAMQAAAFNHAMSLGLKAANAVKGAFVDGAKAALEFQRTTKLLQASLEATGHEVDNNTAALQAQAGALESLLGISDEQIRALQAQALGYGVTADKVDRFLRASFTLAQVTGRDVKTALEGLAKAQNGVVEETLRNTKAFSGLTKEQLENIDATERVMEVYGETFLQEAMDNSATAIERVARAWENVFEALFTIDNSGLVNDVLGEIADQINNIARGLQSPAFKKMMALAAAGPIAMFTGGPLGGLLASFGIAGATEDAALPPEATAPGGASSGGTGTGTSAATKRRKKELSDQQKLAIKQLEEFADLQIERMDEAERVEEELTRIAEDGERQRAEIRRREAEETAEIQRQQFEELRSNLQVGASIATNAIQSLFDDLLSGQEQALSKFVANMLKGVGQTLLGKGIADMAAALASAYIYGNFGGIPFAAAEIGLGSTMLAGGSIVGRGGIGSGGVASGVGSGVVGGPGSNFTSGAGGGGGGPGSGGGGDVIININGIMTSSEAGRELESILADSRRKGAI